MLKGYCRGLISITFLIILLSILTPGKCSAASNQKHFRDLIGGQTFIPDQGEEDSEELFSEYVDRQFAVRRASSGKKRAKMLVGKRLTGVNKAIYDKLSGYITQVAAGELPSTEFQIPIEDMGMEQTVFNASDLGVESIFNDDGRLTDEARASILEKSDCYDLSLILKALLTDHPYELYWYDKTEAVSASGIPITSDYDYDKKEYVLIFSGSIVFSFPVSADYSAGEFQVDTSVGQSVQEAVNTANSIVSRYASYSDEEKLQAYRREICDLVSYNKAAVSGNTAYGNPWQMIWVFDGDPETNVVCEGYAKAFQYLCDQSTFAEDVCCYTVNGLMTGGTGAGAHMWSIVRMSDGNNYLVDVTNCDMGTIGADDQLFMVKAQSGSVEDGYVFQCRGGSITYKYDATIKLIYNDEELTIWDGHNHIWGDGQITRPLTLGQAGERTYTCSVCKKTRTEEILPTADDIESWINALPEVIDLNDQETAQTVAAVRDAYEALSDDQKESVSQEALHKLETIEKFIALGYFPGDVNSDSKVNTSDIVVLRRHVAGGYGVSIHENASDVNGDGKINTSDIVVLRRYLAGGYGVELKPGTVEH